MIKTPLSTVLGGAFWTPEATVINGAKLSFEIVMKKLFTNGEQGFWYDPNDMGTMFRDAAGAVPVTAVGQPVGLIRDKSGRNNHAFQTTSASRPILRQNAVTGAYYLEFDGSDDFLQTNNINFSNTAKVSVFAAIRKLSTVAGMVFELSNNLSLNNGSFYLASPAGTTQPNQVTFVNKGTSFIVAQNPNIPPPMNVVISAKGGISTNTTSLRTNGTLFLGEPGLGTGNYGNYPLYIGRRAGTLLPFNGHIYGLIGVGKLASDNETVAIEKELAKRLGVTLNV
ncbi:hypothetical protein ABTP01_16430 [Acinetobacter baumannii]